jgi:hypothetical protein
MISSVLFIISYRIVRGRQIREIAAAYDKKTRGLVRGATFPGSQAGDSCALIQEVSRR